MKKSELNDICNKIIKMHIDDLKTELPELIKENATDSTSTESQLGHIVANITTNSVAHSVQAVTDVLVNVGLLELEDD